MDLSSIETSIIVGSYIFIGLERSYTINIVDHIGAGLKMGNFLNK